MSTRTLYVKQGDFGTAVRAVLRDGAGDPADLAGATIRFVMRESLEEAVKFAKAGVNDQVGDGSDGTKGHVSYLPVAEDFDTAGKYWQEWEVTYAGGEVTTFPNHGYNTVFVTAELG